MSDLEIIESRLRKQLEQLQKQRGEIEKKLRALEVVRKAAEEIESGDGDGLSDLEALGEITAEASSGTNPPSADTTPPDVSVQDEPVKEPPKEKPPKGDPQPGEPAPKEPPKEKPPAEEPPKKEPPREEPPKEEPPKEDPPKSEPQPVDTAQRQRRDLEASVVGVKLNPEDAVLEVLRVFKQPLKAAKVAEELAAVNFPLDGDPKEVVKASLENLEKEGLVKKSTSLRGVFYTLAEG